jgi:hypothetical protein
MYRIEMDTPGYQEALRRIQKIRPNGWLHLSNLNLTICPPLPDTVIGLFIENNNLTELPNLSETTPNLFILHCSHNQLSALPQLPQSLGEINCSNNRITVLEPLPENLQGLTCNNNQLTVLPELPQNLIALYCESNRLTALPKLPSTLKYLMASNNQITVIPDVPFLSTITFNNNPLIEPFRRFQRAYELSEDRYDFLFKIQGYYKSIRDKGRSINALKHTLGRKGPLLEDVTASIGSFLSGKPGTLNMQTASLKRNAGVQGGRRKTRRNRKTRKEKSRRRHQNKID